MSETGEYSYRPLGGISTAAQWLLYGQAALSLAAATTGYLLGHDFDGSGDSPVYSTLSLLQALVFLIGGIVFFMWLYRAVANVHALGARGFSSSPAMAIVWYFVPIANLGMPYATLRDTWRASAEPRDWEAAPSPAIIRWWWFFWLVGNIAGVIVFRLAMEQGSFEGSEAIAAQLSAVSDVGTAAASLLLAAILARIADMQAGAAPATGSAEVANPARISSN